MRAQNTNKPRQAHIRTTPQTREKLERIMSVKRWTNFDATVDALADHFLDTDTQMRGPAPSRT